MATQTQQIPIGGKLTSTRTQRLSVEELSVLYDRIYDIADRLFKKYNPCNIRVTDNKVYCACKLHTKHRQRALCCKRLGGTNCKYWLNGCTIKCLPCKLFVCNHILYTYGKNDKFIKRKKYKNFVNRLGWLRRIAIKYDISTCSYFHTKQEILDISKKQKNWHKRTGD